MIFIIMTIAVIHKTPQVITVPTECTLSTARQNVLTEFNKQVTQLNMKTISEIQ